MAAFRPEFRYIGRHRRTKEDPRFVTGRGHYVADLALAGMKHVALVASPHACARILSIDLSRVRNAAGVVDVITGAELREGTLSLQIGVDAPKVTRYPLEWTGSTVTAKEHVLLEGSDQARPVGVCVGRGGFQQGIDLFGVDSGHQMFVRLDFMPFFQWLRNGFPIEGIEIKHLSRCRGKLRQYRGEIHGEIAEHCDCCRTNRE